MISNVLRLFVEHVLGTYTPHIFVSDGVVDGW